MEYRPLGSSTVVLSLGCRASRNLRRHGAEAAGSRVHFRASGSGPRSGGGEGLELFAEGATICELRRVPLSYSAGNLASIRLECQAA